ncbi:MAG TPA: phosphoribosyltransferase family protein, partial [Acidimicrobiales bacterium]|nr:phosphoribosyltransferase family protein [Acidimicrobiales bacterium]
MNRGTYVVDIGSQQLELPIVSLNDNLALALLITVDVGVAFLERAGRELAEVLEPYEVDIVATVATMGIPLAVEVTRHLGLDRYVVLHKTPKIHLADAISEPVRSITTDAEQRLLFDRARISDVQGKRVAIVDDVVSTGASTGATLRLLRGVGADVVVIGTLVTE